MHGWFEQAYHNQASFVQQTPCEDMSLSLASLGCLGPFQLFSRVLDRGQRTIGYSIQEYLVSSWFSEGITILVHLIKQYLSSLDIDYFIFRTIWLFRTLSTDDLNLVFIETWSFKLFGASQFMMMISGFFRQTIPLSKNKNYFMEKKKYSSLPKSLLYSS